MNKTPRIKIPLAVRKYVFKRVRYHCKSCSQTTKETRLTIDHIIPLTTDGSNYISNLQKLCSKCNQKNKNHFKPQFK